MSNVGSAPNPFCKAGSYLPKCKTSRRCWTAASATRQTWTSQLSLPQTSRDFRADLLQALTQGFPGEELSSELRLSLWSLLQLKILNLFPGQFASALVAACICLSPCQSASAVSAAPLQLVGDLDHACLCMKLLGRQCLYGILWSVRHTCLSTSISVSSPSHAGPTALILNAMTTHALH